MVKRKHQPCPPTSRNDSVFASLRIQLETVGCQKDAIEEAVATLKEEHHANDEIDPDILFDDALAICNRIVEETGHPEDPDVLAENKEIDAARVLALETAEDERAKRRIARKCTWKVSDILEDA